METERGKYSECGIQKRCIEFLSLSNEANLDLI